MLTLTLEPTDLIIRVNGTPMRVWQGTTQKGTKVHAHIAVVGCDRDADASELEEGLREVAQPRIELHTLGALQAREINELREKLRVAKAVRDDARAAAAKALEEKRDASVQLDCLIAQRDEAEAARDTLKKQIEGVDAALDDLAAPSRGENMVRATSAARIHLLQDNHRWELDKQQEEFDAELVIIDAALARAGFEQQKDSLGRAEKIDTLHQQCEQDLIDKNKLLDILDLRVDELKAIDAALDEANAIHMTGWTRANRIQNLAAQRTTAEAHARTLVDQLVAQKADEVHPRRVQELVAGLATAHDFIETLSKRVRAIENRLGHHRKDDEEETSRSGVRWNSRAVESIATRVSARWEANRPRLQDALVGLIGDGRYEHSGCGGTLTHIDERSEWVCGRCLARGKRLVSP